MFDIKEIIESGINDGIDKTKLLTIIADSIDDGNSKVQTYEKLYYEIYGDTLCDMFCMKLVDNMHNDMEHGRKWTIEQTNDIARKIGITFNSDDYSHYEFWAAMHKEYYCHGNSLKESNIDDPSLFGKFADDYLSSDPKGKLVKYFFWIEKNKENI